MSLADTARKLQEKANAPGYRLLRDLRQIGNTYSWEAVEKKWQEISKFDQTAESLTMDGKQKLCSMMAKAREMDEIGKYCRKIVTMAENAERQRKGKAAEIDIEQVTSEIAAIREKWKKEKKLQMSLFEDEEGR